MQYLLSNEFYKNFNISHFIASRKSWLILVIAIAHIRMQANFRGRENIWQFDIDVHYRRCFQLFWLKSLLFIVYIDKVMWLESMLYEWNLCT